MYSFGSGVLIGTRTDQPTPLSPVTYTPVNFGILQDVTIEETASIKELTGQYQYPVAIARGTIKTTGKAKMAKISGLAFANLFYGNPSSGQAGPIAGQVATSFSEHQVVSASDTVTVTYSASFVEDAGVVYAATGLPLTLVGSSPAPGQYSVAASGSPGTYTFNSSDAKQPVLITYTYSLSSGQQFTVQNQLSGTTPVFKAKFYTTYQNQSVSLQLNACTSSKLSFQTKLEDFVMPEFDFSCFADASNNVMTWSFSEVS